MAKYDSNGFVTELDDNEIFVFGSNTAGRHGKGAALQAKQQFGAYYGQGEGLMGQSYAFPTLDENLQKLPHWRLLLSTAHLYLTSVERPDLTFIITKVGCGLAGYDESYMRSFFLYPAPNMVLPEDWQ
jgi:hypothetical protein